MLDGYEDKLNKQGQTTPSLETTTPTESNNFTKIVEFLSDEKTQNRSEIKEVLDGDEKIKKLFEEFLNSSDNDDAIHLCKRNLKKCSSKDEIKSIILENIPGGYKIGKPEKNIHEEDKIMNEKEGHAQEKEEQAQGKEGKVEEIKERHSGIENLLKATDYRQKLIESHPNSNLEAETGPESDLYKDTKTQLEDKGVINQLKNQLNDQVKEKDKQKKEEIINKFVSDYVLVQATYQAVKYNTSEYSQEEISTFDKIVKNLENACNIPDTKLSSFSDKNISQTRTELFNSDIGNKGLIDLKESNISKRNEKKGEGNSEYDKMFPDKTEEEKVHVYGKFLPNGAKRFLDEYNKHLSDNSIDKYRETEECKQFLQTIENIKLAVDNKTKDLVEELCIISQIKGMYMCMGEGDNFDLNKSNDIKNEDGVLTLKGRVDGVNFSIRQDTNNPEARLQTSQILARKDNSFVVGGENNFIDSNFILPSQDEIFNLAIESINSDGALNDANSPKKYVELMQERFMGRVDKKYENTKYVHHYMQEQVKGERIVNDTLGLIKEVNPNITNDTTLMKNITQESNKNLYDFMKILKFNIDNSTDLEKDHFSRCISKIGEIIRNYTTNKESSGLYSDEISKYLENDTWTDGTQEDRLKLIFNLFNHFNENSIDKSRVGYEGSDGLQTNMFINDLYIQLHDKPKQKQEQQQEQEDKEKETNIAFINLMAAYDQTESMA